MELNRKNLDLELQNKSLTFEEITNLRREFALEESRFVQENEEKIYQIQKDSVDRQKDLISTYASFRSNIISSASDIQGGFADLLFGNRSTGRQSKTAVQTLSKTHLDEFNRLSVQLKTLREKAAAEQERLNTIKLGDSPFLQQLLNEANALDVAIESLKRYGVLQRQAQDIFGTFKATPQGVDKLQEKFLKQRQNAETANINNQIIAQQKNFDLSEGGLAQEKEALKLTELNQQCEALGIGHLAEQEIAYRKSIGGLRDYIQALSGGDKQAAAFAQNSAIKSILEDQASLLEQNIYLQEKINAVGSDSAARFQNAWLTAILAVKEANIQAVESQIQSQVRLSDSATLHTDQVRARVLEHLAEQKTLSETFADGIIGVFDKLTGILNKNLRQARRHSDYWRFIKIRKSANNF